MVAVHFFGTTVLCRWEGQTGHLLLVQFLSQVLGDKETRREGSLAGHVRGGFGVDSVVWGKGWLGKGGGGGGGGGGGKGREEGKE